jgi:potassium efflux system protein
VTGPAEIEQDLTSPDHPLDVKALRAQTAERLKRYTASPGIPGSIDKTPSPESPSRAASQALREILNERQLRLDAYEQALKELQELIHPRVTPEQRAAAARTELERLRSQLAQPPQNLIAPVFRASASAVTDAARAEMKDAIGNAQTEVKEWQSKLEAKRGGVSRAAATQNALRSARDKLFQEVATLKAQSHERTTAVSAAKSPEAQLLSQERLANFRLERRTLALGLQIAEAKLERELKLVEVRELNQHVNEAHVQITQRLLEQMQVKYRDAAESQERNLKRAAATQDDRARRSDDPLERYRARRLADLLEREAAIIKNEQTLAAGTSPALEQERALADRAQADFAEIKKLLDDGNVSRLDALRLNNDFRRIGPERDRLLRNELTSIEAQLQYYENSLTNVELELIEDPLADQMERDLVLERLGPERHGQAQSEFANLERKRRALLSRQKAALTGLVSRAAQTLEQVTRRLNVLEDEYGFIRTHIFWVRDQEPMGLQTVLQCGRELRRLAKGMVKLAQETLDDHMWRQPPSEFLTAVVAAAVLPLGLFRLRRLLRRRISRALPPSHLHGSESEPIRVVMTPAVRRG